jgi:uncharacterized protein (UPF0218 family)
VGYWERVKDFFEIPPKHELVVGDLVTCTCHGGVAVIVQLYDERRGEDYPKMNMARIWWIQKPNTTISQDWMHTIGRLTKFKSAI